VLRHIAGSAILFTFATNPTHATALQSRKNRSQPSGKFRVSIILKTYTESPCLCPEHLRSAQTPAMRSTQQKLIDQQRLQALQWCVMGCIHASIQPPATPRSHPS
jgi:hypothetical protein